MRQSLYDVNGFVLIEGMSRKGGECLGFRCPSCQQTFIWPQSRTKASVTHCGRTDVFSGSWWERIRLPRRRFSSPEPEQLITPLDSNAGETVAYTGGAPKRLMFEDQGSKFAHSFRRPKWQQFDEKDRPR